MSRSDQWVSILIAMLILIHLSVLIIGLIIHKLPVLIPLLNIAVAFSIIIYWIQKQLRIMQHYIDTQEMVILGAEVVVIATAVYFINTAYQHQWVKILQYIFFGIHLAALLLFVVFMLTFKINRLI